MVLNIAAYRFVPVADPHRLAEDVRQRVGSLDLRGTVLVAEEGINLFLAGVEPAVRGFLDFLGADVTNADFENADVTSTRLIGLRGRDKARNLDRVRNLDRALND